MRPRTTGQSAAIVARVRSGVRQGTVPLGVGRAWTHRSPATEARSGARRSARIGAVVVLSIALLVGLRMPAAEASARHEFVDRINDERAAHGLREVRLSHGLHRTATAYSEWMLDAQYFGHLASIRVLRRCWLLGDVLASSDQEYPSAEQIVDHWLVSPSHRAVLLNPRYRFVGVGIASGWLGEMPTTLVTGHFGALARSAARKRRGDSFSSSR